MQDEPNVPKTVYKITSVGGIGVGTLASVATTHQIPIESVPIPLRMLPSALRNKAADIVVRRPKRLPAFLFLLVVFVLIWRYASDRATIAQGLRMGYSVENCVKLELDGAVLSDCVRLTRPTSKAP